MIYDTKAMLLRTRERFHNIIEIGEKQRDELAEAKAEIEDLRFQRSILAERLAELTHIHHGLRYKKEAA